MIIAVGYQQSICGLGHDVFLMAKARIEIKDEIFDDFINLLFIGLISDSGDQHGEGMIQFIMLEWGYIDLLNVFVLATASHGHACVIVLVKSSMTGGAAPDIMPRCSEGE
jgi:hypothetical protein